MISFYSAGDEKESSGKKIEGRDDIEKCGECRQASRRQVFFLTRQRQDGALIV